MANKGVSYITNPGSIPVTSREGSFPRDLEERFSKELNLKDFGAIGDGGKHPLSDYYSTLAEAQVDFPSADDLDTSRDSAAFAEMMIVARTLRSVYVDDGNVATVQNFAYRLKITADKGAYYLNKPVNMTGLNAAHSWWYVDFRGCIFFTNTGAGKCSFDLLDSRKCHWLGGTVIAANQTDVQRIGVQIGRNSTGRPADSNHFDGLEVKGYYTLTPFYNYASEDCLFLQVMAKNDYDSVDATCWVQDSENYFDVSSDYQTTANTDVLGSFLNNHFLRCDFRKTGRGQALTMVAGGVGHVFESIYLATEDDSTIQVIFNTEFRLRGMKLYGHHESDYADADPTTGLKYGVEFIDTQGPRDLRVENFLFRDSYCHASYAMMQVDSSVSTLTFRDTELDFGKATRENPALLFSSPTKVTFNGEIQWSGLYPNFTLAGLTISGAKAIVDDATNATTFPNNAQSVDIVGDSGSYTKNSSKGMVGSTGFYTYDTYTTGAVKRGTLRWNDNYASVGRWELFSGADLNLYAAPAVISPGSDNVSTLGLASSRFAQLYAASGTINTSDEREKTKIESLSDKEKRVAASVKSLVGKYKWLASVDEKGDSARWHFGVGAQSVVAAFEAEGIDAFEYGCVCYDEWEEEVSEEGEVIAEAGSRYGVRADELMFFMMSAM